MSRYPGRCVIYIPGRVFKLFFTPNNCVHLLRLSVPFYLYSSLFITERATNQFADSSVYVFSRPDEIWQQYSRPMYASIIENGFDDDSLWMFLTYSGNRWFSWGLSGKVVEELLINHPYFWPEYHGESSVRLVY